MEEIVRTNHRPFPFVISRSEHNRKLTCCWVELLNFNIEVIYFSRKKDILADTLSRLTTAYNAYEDFFFVAERACEDENGYEVII